MRKLLICLGIILMTSTAAFSATIPEDVQQIINNDFPKTNFRFDGLVILPDNTVYLPLFPAKILDPETLGIKETVPASKTLASKPNIVIFNNDFVLLKVMTDTKGNRTVYSDSKFPPWRASARWRKF